LKAGPILPTLVSTTGKPMAAGANTGDFACIFPAGRGLVSDRSRGTRGRFTSPPGPVMLVPRIRNAELLLERCERKSRATHDPSLPVVLSSTGVL
jgi:hypothetical protein